MKKTTYHNGQIIREDSFYRPVRYDISNNTLLAHFDGRGGIGGYSVVNKWDFIQNSYNIIAINGNVIDSATPKKVTMAGRRQIIECETPAARLKIVQFADSATNAVFQEYEIYAKEDINFRTVSNYEINYQSYIVNFFTARFSLKNLNRLIFGSLKGLAKGRITVETSGEFSAVRSDPIGEFYLDIAMSSGGKPLESNSFFVNQFEMSADIKAGESRSLKSVFSAGTRGDYSAANVLELIKDFSNKRLEAEEYIASLPAPEKEEGEFVTAYFKNLYNTALTMYKEVGEFKGFLAGIVYQSPARTYFRDSYWTILAVLKHRPELVRNQIITLSKGIDKDGKCPSAVRYNFKNWWGNHYDSPSFFAIMLYDYVRMTGDFSILDEKWRKSTILDAAVKVINKLAEYEDDTGLLYKGGAYNRRDWADNVFREGYVAYDEALYARALYALSELLEGRDKTYASRFRDKFNKVKLAINTILWDTERGYYVNYKSENFKEDNLSIDTVITVLFGIAEGERAVSVLKNMERFLESKNNSLQTAGDFGVLSVYPFYQRADAVVAKSTLPYSYHNGGDWPYWSALYAYAKLMYGMDYKYPLTRWFEYNIEQDNFTPVEFFAPMHPQGSLLQAWSSVGAFVLSYPQGDYFNKEIIH
ncbi:MAG: amylo-alpha-1,6-glucosidase [Clostridia bacterium]